MNLCWIARKENIQWNIWDIVRPIFRSKYKGDIRNIRSKKDCEILGYPKRFVPYNWLPNLSEYLRENGVSFKEFLRSMDQRTGTQIMIN